MVESVSVQRLVVSVSSLPRALAFYVDALGLRVTGSVDEQARLETADGVEILLHERDTAPSDTAVAIGFATAALEETVARCVDAGGVVVDPVETRPWGERMAVLRDVDGHIVCVSERS